MSLVRSLANDLVQKRLWPIAAALVVAIVAVPLLLAGGSSTPGPSAPPATGPATGSAPAALPASARVTLDTTPAARKYRGGRVRNPFRQRAEPQLAATPSAPAVSAGSAGDSASGTAATGIPVSKPGGGSTTAPAEAEPPAVIRVDKPAAATGIRYRVSWRFGREGALHSNHDAARLTVLPARSNPVAQFLGILDDRRTVVFRLRPGTSVAGEARCVPSLAECHLIEMRRRDVVELSYTDAAGVVQRYRLGISNVARRKVTDAAARRSYRRVSKAGRAVLRDATEAKLPGTSAVVYVRSKGLLKPLY